MALECMAVLSYDRRARHGVEHEGCTRRASLMMRDIRMPVCWQHARCLWWGGGPAVTLDEMACKEWGTARTWRPRRPRSN